MRTRRTFHARWNAERQWWNLYCRECGTMEGIPQDNFPEEVAQVHALWFHLSQPKIPVGWANPH